MITSKHNISLRTTKFEKKENKLELNGDSTVANLRMKNGPSRIWSGRERRG